LDMRCRRRHPDGALTNCCRTSGTLSQLRSTEVSECFGNPIY
jgi:hypothetical protein